MKMKKVPEGTIPLDVDPEDSDESLMDAVIGHWHERLMASDQREAILASLGLSTGDAKRLRIGLSDRTLGLRLPDRRWKAGLALRGRLTSLGVLRDSGHEALRGCVVVPIRHPSRSLVGLFGLPIDRTRPHVWANGLPGGVFCAGDGDGNDDTGPMVVVSSILDALAVMGTGHRAVVAPGRKKGFSVDDLSSLTGRGELVLLGQHGEALAERLAALGASVTVAASDVVIGETLVSARVPANAFAALLADRRSALATSGAGAGEMGDEANDGAAIPMHVVRSEGRDEVFIRSTTHSWRVRGAGARANVESEVLRVALMVSDGPSGRFHLDSLDLYSARQRQAFVEAATSELHATREVVSGEMAEVIAAAEQCRDEVSPPTSAAAVVISDAERAEALALLSSPSLIERVGEDLATLGVVGETTNLLICYLATISRLCERPFGVVVQSSSAAGKSTLTDAVCSLVPPEDLVALSAITTQALYYLGGGDLSHKVLSVAEEQGAVRASYALKLLVSEGRLSIASTGKDRSTGRLATANYEIAGPVALVMTTTATDIDPELENRLVVLGVDEDSTQTRAILEAQRRAVSLEGLAARTTRDEVRRLHANAQRLLSSFPVVIPNFVADFPVSATRHRRDHAKLLSIIAAVTVLHQHQREHKTLSVGAATLTYLEATDDDVALGLSLIERIVSRSSEHLSPQTARLLQCVIDHVSTEASLQACTLFEVGVTRRELRELLGWSDVQVRAATDRLVVLEYLVASGGGRGRCRTYHYVPPVVQVRGRNGSVRGSGSRTSDPSSPGETDELVGLVGLSEARDASSTFVVPYTKEPS
jgi:hypothetical protein